MMTEMIVKVLTAIMEVVLMKSMTFIVSAMLDTLESTALTTLMIAKVLTAIMEFALMRSTAFIVSAMLDTLENSVSPTLTIVKALTAATMGSAWMESMASHASATLASLEMFVKNNNRVS